MIGPGKFGNVEYDPKMEKGSSDVYRYKYLYATTNLTPIQGHVTVEDAVVINSGGVEGVDRVTKVTEISR